MCIRDSTDDIRPEGGCQYLSGMAAVKIQPAVRAVQLSGEIQPGRDHAAVRTHGAVFVPQPKHIRAVFARGAARQQRAALPVSYTHLVLTRTPPEPYGTLLRPVQILNALVEAAQTGREAFVAPPLE